MAQVVKHVPLVALAPATVHGLMSRGHQRHKNNTSEIQVRMILGCRRTTRGNKEGAWHQLLCTVWQWSG